jgi:hypothetical protein
VRAARSSSGVAARVKGVRVAAHRARRSTPWGVPKTRSNPGESACSSVPKMPPPSLFVTTIVRSGRGSSGPRTSPFASCRKVRSPSSA